MTLSREREDTAGALSNLKPSKWVQAEHPAHT